MKELVEYQKKYVVGLFYEHNEKMQSKVYTNRFLRDKGLIEPELEVGWYILKNYVSDAYIGYIDDPSEIACPYWFTDTGHYSEYSGGFDSIVRKATDEEVKEALIAEAKKRGFSNGSVKCKFKHQIYPMSIEGGYYEFDSNENILSIGGTYIFQNGKWAEVVETIPSYTMEEAVEKMGHEFKIKK